MNIRCIIIEDEPLAMDRTKAYVQKIPFLELLAAFNNAEAAKEYLKKDQVDLLFLDIHLGKTSGIQLLKGITTKSQVIFITAYQDYALQGYDLNITDYLLKPFTFERFAQSVNKARNNHAKQEHTPDRTCIFIKTEFRLEKIEFTNILYIEGKRDYRQIVTTAGSVMTHQTFKELEKEIPLSIICRVHKSYMVAIAKIERIEKNVILIGNKNIPISETFKKELFRILTN